MRKLCLRLAIAFATLLAVVLAAEVVLRLRRPAGFDAAAARAASVQLLVTINGDLWRPTMADDRAAADKFASEPTFRIHPYYGLDYSASDDWSTKAVRESRSPDAERCVDIVILGGSVAAAFGNICKDEITEAFARDPRWAGWKARVLVQARAAFHQPQLLHSLEYLLAIGYRPDIVVELDGFNELALGVQNAQRGVHPALPSIVDWGPIATAAPMTPAVLDQIAELRSVQVGSQSWFETADRWGAFHSALATWCVQSRLQKLSARFATATSKLKFMRSEPAARTFVVGPKVDSDENAAIDSCVDIWAGSSVMMDAVCDRLGIRYVHVLQPTMHDKGSKPLTPDEMRLGSQPADWARTIERGYPKLHERGAQLAKEGIEFVDLSGAFAKSPQSLYYDICHFSLEGNHILDAALLPVLLGKPPGSPPPAQSEHEAASKSDK